ncbi:MAG: hypothetical protein EBZ49_15545, partial [Proteobacteria bacterium]|nr:hypothetical protein [Pseudomonadota bacterium]
SLKCEKNELKFAVPGSLIAISAGTTSAASCMKISVFFKAIAFFIKQYLKVAGLTQMPPVN